RIPNSGADIEPTMRHFWLWPSANRPETRILRRRKPPWRPAGNPRRIVGREMPARKRKSRDDSRLSRKNILPVSEKPSASSSSPLCEQASWPFFSVSLWVFSWARPSFSPPVSSAPGGPPARVSAPEPLLPVPRLRWRAPLPQFRRSPGTRRPALLRLPAVTARCRLRNSLSRYPFGPPLGESHSPAATLASTGAVVAGVLADRPVPAALFVIG